MKFLILLVLSFASAIAVSSQTVVQKSDRDLLIEIRQMLVEQRLSSMRAQLLVKKIEIETNTLAELVKELDGLHDKLEQNGGQQASATKRLNNYRQKPLRASEKDEEQTPEGERADEITGTQDQLEELSDKAVTLDVKIKRVAARIEATKQKLSQLEADLSKM